MIGGEHVATWSHQRTGPGSGGLLPGTAVHALQAVDQAVLVADRDGLVVFCNHAADTIDEWSTTNAAGHHLVKVLMPDATPRRIGQIMVFLRAGQPWSAEHAVHRGDGSSIAAVVTASPVFDAAGALTSVVAVSRLGGGVDLSAQLLADTRRQYGAFLETTGDTFAVLDEHSVFTYLDGAVRERFGVDPESLIGTSMLSLVPPIERERAEARWEERVATRGPMENESFWFQDSGGGWLCLAVHGLNLLDDPAVAGVVLSFRDVTSARRAEYERRVNAGAKEVLVRASTEQELFDGIAALVVSELGTLTSWVLVEDPGRPLGLAPATTRPQGLEFFRALEQLSGSENVPDPLTLAMITGQHQFVDDLRALPESVRWRGAALEHGFRSVLALPFSPGEGEHGLFVTCADRPHVITADRIAVLTALADDLGHGVEAIRTREQRATYRDRLEASLEAAVRAIAAAAALRDPYTADHQRQVAELAVAIAEELGCDEDFSSGIRVAGLIHDIGKLAVPAEILSRPGRLTTAEFELIKGHAQAGHEIIADIEFPWDIADMILQHHERLDGSGYPSGLRGEEICIGARILAVADTVEAMQAHRPYRPALGIEAALRVISSDRGVLFDAGVADACIRLFNEQRFRFGD